MLLKLRGPWHGDLGLQRRQTQVVQVLRPYMARGMRRELSTHWRRTGRRLHHPMIAMMVMCHATLVRNSGRLIGYS